VTTVGAEGESEERGIGKFVSALVH
jgi:hypothetical protein